ncbi:hypothetical protein BCR33DRAFT_713056 [Rhizoclosmatium globosum]|uniref:Uncharacterized protein n=1 Tax=Rhizoclosmatium globosum TaxID=329046 RepID=A0A1Y2BGG0_9FUNG|nr:hypothetical protein BCR33DRAFT_723104 [Rhizoclosmatium globosum]ORY50222.1 hypothetical protein BCR33DRAFT_713056 [Rhizoclosmatium globosum]|eukprot:ORY33893.1 hypothetical protein BCR33DRAFT_723104 [Rhizoclosmatium globosum]
MIISNFLGVIFQYLYAFCADPELTVIYICLSGTFSAIFQYLIVVYTWNRGLPVIKSTIPWIQPFLVVFIVLYALLQVEQAILFALSNVSFYLPILNDDLELFIMIVNIQSILIDVLMGSFDLLVTGVYIYYLWSVSRVNDQLDVKNLVIISWFGVASFICIEFWLTFYVLYSIWANTFGPNMTLLAFTISLHINNLGPLLYLVIQVGLKFALLRDKQNSKARRTKINSKSTGTSKSKD